MRPIYFYYFLTDNVQLRVTTSMPTKRPQACSIKASAKPKITSLTYLMMRALWLLQSVPSHSYLGSNYRGVAK
ncbi:MAG: hypothetical protein WA220_09180 [Candidatus Nitrosopolaris sp.]